MFLYDYSSGGYYVYLESSKGRTGFKAQLQSPTFNIPAQGKGCFSFWYHMYGPRVNTLNVYVKKSGKLGNPVFRKSGNKGNKWIYGQLNLQAGNNEQVWCDSF